MWNKSELKPEGVTRVTIPNPRNDKKYSVEFVVVKEELTPLLGAKASQHMGPSQNITRKFCAGSRRQTAELRSRQVQDR